MSVVHDVMCTVHYVGVYIQSPKIINVIPYNLIFNSLKFLKERLPLKLLTALLSTLLTTYFRFGGWRYTLFVLTNHNHCYMPKLNDLFLFKHLQHSTVLHELMHAIGFRHEQSRSDRDLYVTINYDNVRDGKESQFRMRNTWNRNAYDLESIMHYGLRVCKYNREKKRSYPVLWQTLLFQQKIQIPNMLTFSGFGEVKHY